MNNEELKELIRENCPEEELDGIIILEECDDDNTFYYYNVDPNTGNTEYYGLVDSISGIFDDDYDGFPYINDEGIIELNSNFC